MVQCGHHDVDFRSWPPSVVSPTPDHSPVCILPTYSHRLLPHPRVYPALLPIAGGVIDPEATMDREEADECRKMHSIVEKYDMKGCFRWTVAQARIRQQGRGVRWVRGWAWVGLRAIVGVSWHEGPLPLDRGTGKSGSTSRVWGVGGRGMRGSRGGEGQ